MKRILAIFLLLIYTTSVFGVTVHVHYCMKKFAGISLLQGANEACKKCGMKNTKSRCCKDEQKKILLKTDHQQAPGPALKLLTVFPAGITAELYHIHLPVLPVTVHYSTHAPPGPQMNRLYLFNSTFLI